MTICNHTGCTFQSRSKGLCSKHGTKRIRIYCSVAGCTNHGRGREHLCYKHRLRPGDDKNFPPTVIKKLKRQSCITDACDKIARGKHGLCAKHYRLINNKSLPCTNRKRPLDGQDTIKPPVITILDNQIEALESKRQRIDLKLNALNKKKNGLMLIVPTLMERDGLTDDDKQQSISTLTEGECLADGYKQPLAPPLPPSFLMGPPESVTVSIIINHDNDARQCSITSVSSSLNFLGNHKDEDDEKEERYFC